MDYYEDQYMAANGPRWQRDGDRAEARKAALLEAAGWAEEEAAGWRDRPCAGPGYRGRADALFRFAKRLRTAAE